MRKNYSLLFVLLGLLTCGNMKAQLNQNPDKFLGNITTRGSVNGGGVEFASLWDQITPENESKWSSIEGGSRGQFNWGGCDNAVNYAKSHNFPFKFHTLIWGSQYPGWMDNLSKDQQYKAIVEWMDAIQKRYPNLDMIDVVNEAVPGHAPAPYKDALGGDGKTGYDWIIKAFEMAHERWPDAILIYNDYNTFQWQRTQFIDLVKTLRDAGAPIDAYGCQSHDLTGYSLSNFKSAMNEIQNALKMPMYSTEYDIGTTDDNQQYTNYSEQIKYMWECDYVAGITLWGYIYGATWTTDGNSGIIRDGKDRPAMKWLREYMASDAAKNAKSPFPGKKKEASVYVKPAQWNATVKDTTTIEVRASMRTKQIEKVELYTGSTLIASMTESPYIAEYFPTRTGKVSLKAIVYTTDGSTYERLGGFNVCEPRAPYKDTPTELPGTLQAENFDSGADGISFHDSDSKDEGGTSYRRNGGGVDIVTGNGGYAIGYTNAGEWMEYTVNVTEPGLYSYEAYVSAGATGASISIGLSDEGTVTDLTGVLDIPCITSGNWDTYRAVCGRLSKELKEGQQVIRISVTGSQCNIDKVVFKKVELNSGLKVSLAADPSPATVNKSTVISAKVTIPEETTVSKVLFYVNNILNKTVVAEPYQITYRPTAKGTYLINAVAVDANGAQSNLAKMNLTVQKARSAYKGAITIPGTIEAENFDKGEDGLTFHDSDTEDEGGAKYRTDNEGVDITTGNGGYVIGYTQANEWLEYTVNVTEPGKYSYEAVVSSGADGSAFTLYLNNNGKLTALTSKVTVPNSGSWDTYRTVKGNLLRQLSEGQQIFRLTITGAYCNIDKLNLICTLNTGIEEVIDLTGGTYAVYSTTGVYAGEMMVGGSETLSKQLGNFTGKTGVYILKDRKTGKSRKVAATK